MCKVPRTCQRSNPASRRSIGTSHPAFCLSARSSQGLPSPPGFLGCSASSWLQSVSSSCDNRPLFPLRALSVSVFLCRRLLLLRDQFVLVCGGKVQASYLPAATFIIQRTFSLAALNLACSGCCIRGHLLTHSPS